MSNLFTSVCSTVQNVGALTTLDTVTVALLGSSTAAAYVLEEFSGLASSSYVDVSAANQSSAAVTSGSTGTTPTTSQAVSLAVACVGTPGNSGSVTFGSYSAFSTASVFSDNSGTGRRLGGSYKILAATGTQSETFTYVTSDVYAGSVVVYSSVAVPPPLYEPSFRFRF